MSRLPSFLTVVINDQEFQLNETVRIDFIDSVSRRFWSVCFIIVLITENWIEMVCSHNHSDQRRFFINDWQLKDQRFSFTKV